MCWFRNFFLDPYPEVFVRIQAKIKKRINNQNFTSLGFNRKENTVKCSFKSDTGSSSLFFIDYNMFKSIGVGPELFKNRKRIRNKSFRTYITRFSVIDLHGRRIHELLVDVQVYYEIFFDRLL